VLVVVVWHAVNDPIADGSTKPSDCAASVPALAVICFELRIIGSLGLIVNCGRIDGFRAM
jgi:hypothetical protein